MASFLCVFALCSLVGVRFSFALKCMILLLCISGTVCFFLFRKRIKWARTACAFLLSAALSMTVSLLYFNGYYAAMQAYNGESVTAEGEVLLREDSSMRYRVRIISLNGESIYTRAVLETDFKSSLQVGDRFAVTAVPRPFEESEDYSEERADLSDGCTMILVCQSLKDYTRIPQKGFDLSAAIYRLNLSLSNRVVNAVGGEEGALAAALFLGNRTFLSKDTALHFRRAGISHLLALSGLHVSILIGFFEVLLRLFAIPKKLRAGIIPIAAIGYLFLTGASVSTARAVLMICVLYIGYFLMEDYDSFTSLSLVLAVILLATPYAVLDISLWMSFLAAASIIIFSPLSKRLTEPLASRLPYPAFRLLRAVISATVVGFVANLALALLSAVEFGELSWASIPSTLLLSLPVSLILSISLFVLMIPPLGAVVKPLLAFTLKVAEIFSGIFGVLINMTDLPTLLPLLLMSTCLAVFAVIKIKNNRMWLLPPALFLLSLLCALTLRGTAGERSNTLFEGNIKISVTQNEAVVVCNFATKSNEAYKLSRAVKDLKGSEIRELHLSCYQNRSAYFIYCLSSYMRVDTLYLPKPENDTERAIAARLCEEAELHGITVSYY